MSFGGTRRLRLRAGIELLVEFYNNETKGSFGLVSWIHLAPYGATAKGLGENHAWAFDLLQAVVAPSCRRVVMPSWLPEDCRRWFADRCCAVQSGRRAVGPSSTRCCSVVSFGVSRGLRLRAGHLTDGVLPIKTERPFGFRYGARGLKKACWPFGNHMCGLLLWAVSSCRHLMPSSCHRRAATCCRAVINLAVVAPSTCRRRADVSTCHRAVV